MGCVWLLTDSPSKRCSEELRYATNCSDETHCLCALCKREDVGGEEQLHPNGTRAEAKEGV